MHGVTRVGAVVVPLVVPVPARRQVRRRLVRVVLDLDGRVLVLRVAVEVRADQLAVPRPVVLGVGRRVDARVPAAVLDVALERGLLVVVEDVARRGQPHDGVVLREVLVRERSCVLGRGHLEVVLLAELLDRRDARGDRPVPEPGGLAEDEHVERCGVGGGGDRSRRSDAPGGGGRRGRHRRRDGQGRAIAAAAAAATVRLMASDPPSTFLTRSPRRDGESVLRSAGCRHRPAAVPGFRPTILIARRTKCAPSLRARPPFLRSGSGRPRCAATADTVGPVSGSASAPRADRTRYYGWTQPPDAALRSTASSTRWTTRPSAKVGAGCVPAAMPSTRSTTWCVKACS